MLMSKFIHNSIKSSLDVYYDNSDHDTLLPDPTISENIYHTLFTWFDKNNVDKDDIRVYYTFTFSDEKEEILVVTFIGNDGKIITSEFELPEKTYNIGNLCSLGLNIKNDEISNRKLFMDDILDIMNNLLNIIRVN